MSVCTLSLQDNPVSVFIPGVFRLPIANVAANESVCVEVDYMQELEYIDNHFHFLVPLRFAPGLLPANVPVHQMISLQSSINCLCPGINYGSSSHALRLTAHENLRVELFGMPLPRNQMRSVDYHVAYRLQTPQITAYVVLWVCLFVCLFSLE